MALVTPPAYLKAALSLGAWRRQLQEQYICFLVHADKKEGREKEEATIKQGLFRVKPQGWVLQKETYCPGKGEMAATTKYHQIRNAYHW